MSMELLLLRVKGMVRETRETLSLLLEEVDGYPVSYEAGQFLTFVFVFHGRELRRSYSLSSTPGVDRDLMITIRRIPNGEVSRYLLEHCRVGDILRSLPPFGRFTLQTDAALQRRLFFIGAGSGLTPIFSLIKKALLEEPLSQVTLISQDREKESMLFREALEELARRFPSRFHWIAYLSHPGMPETGRIAGGWGTDRTVKQGKDAEDAGRVSPETDRSGGEAHQPDRKESRASPEIRAGRLTNEGLEMLVAGRPEFSGEGFRGESSLFFLCGPLSFMRMARFTLRWMGVPDLAIRRENFTVESIPPPLLLPDSAPRQVAIHYGGQTHTLRVAYPDSILTAALRQEIALPYSCRGGRCSTCAAKCLRGKVIMSVNEVLTEKDMEEGWILTCTGYPETDVEITYSW